MSSLKIVYTLVLFLGSFCGSMTMSRAQTHPSAAWSYRYQINGGTGYSALYHGDSHQFSGSMLQGGFGVRPFQGAWKGIGLGARFSHLHSDSEEWSGMNLFSAVVEYEFGSSPIRPYVLGGIGLIRGERKVTVAYGDETGIFREESYNETLSRAGLDLGAGLRAALGRGWFLQPEFRLLDTTAGEGYNLSIPQLTVGLGYSW